MFHRFTLNLYGVRIEAPNGQGDRRAAPTFAK